MEYNYREAVKEDIIEYIKEDMEFKKMNLMDYLEEYEDTLHDSMWAQDTITGNASGSYTFSTWQAAEYLTHNWDILEEALTEFDCTDINVIEKGEEWADVTIRCYLLGECLADAIEELKGE